MNLPHRFIGWKARQHDIAAGGKFRDAFRDCGAVSNELLRLAAVPVIRRQPETGLKQPPCNRLAHIADSYKPEPACLWYDGIHGGSPFAADGLSLPTSGPRLSSGSGANSISWSAPSILRRSGLCCRRRHEFRADWIGDRLPQNLIDGCARIGVKFP